MRNGPSIALALAAAALFAVAAVLQQESTLGVDPEKSLTLGLLVDLFRRPKWLLGGLCMVGGFSLQAAALAFGPIAVVQPVVVTELAFAIPLGILRRHRKAGRHEWAGILAVMSGVSVFILAANPARGVQNPPGRDWVGSLVPVAAVAAVAVLAGAARRGKARAMFLGAAAGISFGMLSVLTKAAAHLISKDVAKALTTWQVYATIGVGVVALVVSQSAYQAGPLAWSMPFVGVLEPLVAVVIGDVVLNEQIRLSEASFSVELLAAAVACAGILLLTTSQTVLSIYEERAEQQHCVA